MGVYIGLIPQVIGSAETDVDEASIQRNVGLNDVEVGQ